MPSSSSTPAPAAFERVCVHDKLGVSIPAHERRLHWVVVITAAAMAIELVMGFLSHSLALVAEGWHMGCHAGAMGLSAFAYWFARAQSGNRAFAFGTGKIYSLAGYTNALILLLVAGWTIFEGVSRFFDPVSIHFREAFPTAVFGLLVNIICLGLLGERHTHHDHYDDPSEDHHHDHNIRAAYLHILADALTSIAALVALLGARFAHFPSLDPLMAIVSSLVVLRWGVALARTSSQHLLDATSRENERQSIIETLHSLGARVIDLHLWELGPKQKGCVVTLQVDNERSVDIYRHAIAKKVSLHHLTIELQFADRSG